MLGLYLRGQLSPNLPQGLSSRLRENLLLDVVAADAHSADLMDRLQVETAIFPVAKNPSAHLQRVRDTEERLRVLREYDLPQLLYDAYKADRLLQASKDMMEAYKVLEKSGKLRDIVNKALRERAKHSKPI